MAAFQPALAVWCRAFESFLLTGGSSGPPSAAVTEPALAACATVASSGDASTEAEAWSGAAAAAAEETRAEPTSDSVAAGGTLLRAQLSQVNPAAPWPFRNAPLLSFGWFWGPRRAAFVARARQQIAQRAGAAAAVSAAAAGTGSDVSGGDITSPTWALEIALHAVEQRPEEAASIVNPRYSVDAMVQFFAVVSSHPPPGPARPESYGSAPVIYRWAITTMAQTALSLAWALAASGSAKSTLPATVSEQCIEKPGIVAGAGAASPSAVAATGAGAIDGDGCDDAEEGAAHRAASAAGSSAPLHLSRTFRLEYTGQTTQAARRAREHAAAGVRGSAGTRLIKAVAAEDAKAVAPSAAGAAPTSDALDVTAGADNNAARVDNCGANPISVAVLFSPVHVKAGLDSLQAATRDSSMALADTLDALEGASIATSRADPCAISLQLALVYEPGKTWGEPTDARALTLLFSRAGTAYKLQHSCDDATLFGTPASAVVPDLVRRAIEAGVLPATPLHDVAAAGGGGGGGGCNDASLSSDASSGSPLPPPPLSQPAPSSSSTAAVPTADDITFAELRERYLRAVCGPRRARSCEGKHTFPCRYCGSLVRSGAVSHIDSKRFYYYCSSPTCRTSVTRNEVPLPSRRGRRNRGTTAQSASGVAAPPPHFRLRRGASLSAWRAHRTSRCCSCARGTLCPPASPTTRTWRPCACGGARRPIWGWRRMAPAPVVARPPHRRRTTRKSAPGQPRTQPAAVAVTAAPATAAAAARRRVAPPRHCRCCPRRSGCRTCRCMP
jgi:hypothetical protein